MAETYGHRTHGLECYRDVYLGITEGFELTNYFGNNSNKNLIKQSYIEESEEGGQFLRREEVEEDGFFYIPTHLVQDEIVYQQDINQIDQFELTIIADFLVTNKVNVKYGDYSKEYNFENRAVPYYPLMDSVLLGALKARIKVGYVNAPDKYKLLNGLCIGIQPRFRPDGIPLVTFTFRDLSWQLGMHNVICTYPVLGKNSDLSNAISKRKYTNPDEEPSTKNKAGDNNPISTSSGVPNSKYFSYNEFCCNDDNSTEPPEIYWGNLQELMNNLDIIREELGSKIIVNSGYRTIEHNKLNKGVSNSAHLEAKAADISSPDKSAKEIYLVVKRLISEGKIKNGGFAPYNTFVHYDISYSRRWNLNIARKYDS